LLKKSIYKLCFVKKKYVWRAIHTSSRCLLHVIFVFDRWQPTSLDWPLLEDVSWSEKTDLDGRVNFLTPIKSEIFYFYGWNWGLCIEFLKKKKLEKLIFIVKFYT